VHTLPLQQELDQFSLSGNTTIEKIDGANHLFSTVEWSAQVIKLTTDWVNALFDKKLSYGNTSAKQRS
jgi:hypothetical protein